MITEESYYTRDVLDFRLAVRYELSLALATTAEVERAEIDIGLASMLDNVEQFQLVAAIPMEV